MIEEDHDVARELQEGLIPMGPRGPEDPTKDQDVQLELLNLPEGFIPIGPRGPEDPTQGLFLQDLIERLELCKRNFIVQNLISKPRAILTFSE